MTSYGYITIYDADETDIRHPEIARYLKEKYEQKSNVFLKRRVYLVYDDTRMIPYNLEKQAKLNNHMKHLKKFYNDKEIILDTWQTYV